MTDLRPEFYLSVNSIDAYHLNDFFAVKKACEPPQRFSPIQIIKFHLNHHPLYLLKMSRLFQRII
jgi:hypothetical protein